VINQKAGDMVVLQPGTLHWVRSRGMTTQTAWNFADFDILQLQQMHERFKINKEIKFQTIIAFLTLITDLCIEKKITCPKMLKYCHSFLEKEINEHLALKSRFATDLSKIVNTNCT
jgi:RAB protein geranylgeranyltransferase component A